MAAKTYRDIKNEFPLDEGKLVSNQLNTIKTVMKKLQDRAVKELENNHEKGLAFLNTIASFVGAKVSDKKQKQGKLFLKLDFDMDESIQEDAAVDAAKLKATQVQEMEALKEKQAAEMEAMKERHARENEKVALDKEKEAENKAIEAEREAARKAAQNESVQEKLGADADVGDYIKDFRKSDAPQFKGKSDKKIRQMAIAAWKDAQ
tara:strand:+ start:10686 stop:11303 length:618 start_codon:yes stop_codon:yes gene_type:complete